MKTCTSFVPKPTLTCTASQTTFGEHLPWENRPWTLMHQLTWGGKWPSGVGKAVIAASMLKGFSLSNYRAAKPIIASDGVEGTAVYDPSGSRIGTIQAIDNREGERENSVRRHNVRRLPRNSGNIPTPSPGRSSVSAKGSADIAPTSQPSRSGCSGLLRR